MRGSRAAANGRGRLLVGPRRGRVEDAGQLGRIREHRRYVDVARADLWVLRRKGPCLRPRLGADDGVVAHSRQAQEGVGQIGGLGVVGPSGVAGIALDELHASLETGPAWETVAAG